MVLAFLLCLLTPVAARLCGDDGGVIEGALCDQEGKVCGPCQCNSLGQWVCESIPTAEEEAHDEDDDDCASIDFHADGCTDWQEGKSCGDCTCFSQEWVCGGGALQADKIYSYTRELQILSDEECQGISELDEDGNCTEVGRICGNCVCMDVLGGLSWVCARQGDRIQQCLGVEDGKFCRWIERGAKCGACECMPNNRWSCPSFLNISFCDDVDDSQDCLWKDRGAMCGTCFCWTAFWVCPETLCNNIFPGKFCLWRDRGRTCFGCECIANRWVCPETTPTRQELCAEDLFDGKFCRWRDEGRFCVRNQCVCRENRWRCAAPCAVDSCSGEQTTAVSLPDSERTSVCFLPPGLRGLEVEFEVSSGRMSLNLFNGDWISLESTGELVVGFFCRIGSCPPGTNPMGFGVGKEDYEQNPAVYNGESPGKDQLERNIATNINTVAWNPDFPSVATVYGYEVALNTITAFNTSTGTLTYRWTCNEDPALACACALG